MYYGHLRAFESVACVGHPLSGVVFVAFCISLHQQQSAIRSRHLDRAVYSTSTPVEAAPGQQPRCAALGKLNGWWTREAVPAPRSDGGARPLGYRGSADPRILINPLA
jgi:hypothetical protein